VRIGEAQDSHVSRDKGGADRERPREITRMTHEREAPRGEIAEL